MRIKVEVTERDIRLGSRFEMEPKLCPIARALKRHTTNVSCGYENVTINSWTFELPKKCLVFQDKLFARESVKPFSFSLSVPEGVL